MSIKAKLRVVLHADDTVVAETDDAGLWHKVLLAINSGGSLDLPVTGKGSTAQEVPPPEQGAPTAPSLDNAIKAFSTAIGLSVEVVSGACGPDLAEPFLHLDKHCWKAMKDQTPERGPTAYSGMAIASTLLALWFKHAGLGDPTQAQAQAVLSTIGHRDQNPGRGIERSDWLQPRAGGIVRLHPAKLARATEIARSFCAQDWSKSDTA